MTPERWRKVEEVFESALERAPEERSAYLTNVCADDEPLRQQVETLIASYEKAGSFIEEPAMGIAVLPDTLVDETVSTIIGRRLGSYKIVREIGRGGMGSVYLAMRADDEFQKRVAIKLIKRGMDTDFIIRRFRNERQILASLDHPNIARLLDGGTTEDGLPYFVMEFVEGQPIHHYCDTQKLSTVERLRLFVKACQAVEYAHNNLIIHRDLKPSNILVTAEGTPKLLDFGIAKILNPEIASQTLDPTTAALRLMTPEYASPEQVRGFPAMTGSDVYSLGVLLYELLTGHRPYRLYNRLPEEIARVICEEEPERPSVVINRIEHIPLGNGSYKVEVTPESVSRTRDGTPDKLRRQLVGNIDNIILKALRKEPQRRYSTVGEFAEDIRRHLEGQPVSAPAYFIAARTEYEMSDTPTGSRAIAVLPFKMLRQEEKTDEYLGLGMADAIITKLSNIRRIIVRPTSSVLKYASGDSDLLAAGHELDVGFVLDGRIQRAADRVRVTVQLIRVRDGAPLWAAKFDEKFTDIFTVEDSISGQVAQALIPKLSGEEQQLLSKRETENAQAYQAYLKGRYYWNTYTEEGLAQAIFHFMEAIEEDPEYAQAYAGVADYYNFLGVWGVLPPKESFAAAKNAAGKALEIDSNLAEAHTSLAFSLLAYDWDWETAEAEFKRAIALNPSYATAHQWYAYLAGAQGRHADAITEIEYAQRLDPLSPVIATSAGLIFYNARQYDRSLEELEKALEIDGRYFVTYQGFAFCYAQKGRFDEALVAARKAVAISSRNPLALWALGFVLAVAGRADEAREVLGEMEELRQKRYVSPYYIAMIHAGLGERDEAFNWLEKAYEDRDWWLLWLRVEPFIDELRSDPRFQNLLRRVAHDEAETARITVHETNSDKQSPDTGETRGGDERKGWWPPRPQLIGAGAALLALLGITVVFILFMRSSGKGTGVTRLTTDAAADVQPRWSPDMSRIAFASARDGKYEIYTMDRDGKSLQRLTFNSVDDFMPAWSPDGQKIAFTSKRDGNDEIYVMNADSSNQENLTKHPADDSRPAWSPDGRKLVFTSNRGEDPANFDLYMVDADGGNPVRLTTDVGFDSDPAWSPDGRKIAFSSKRTGNFEVYVMNTDGSQQANISHNSSYNGKPAWSPDGKQIAFTSNRTTKFEIFLMAPDGSNQRQLTDTGVTNDEPSWSRDGSEIVYQSEREGNNDIYMMSASIGETRPAAADPVARAGARSIAVLPFRTIGADEDKPYGTGLADLLITRLTQLKRITVRPSSEVRAYLNSTTEPREIGRVLGVECVLDGEVTQLDDRIQVTARLFSVAEGSLLWSQKFDQKISDMQTVQDAISDRVVREMKLELTTDEKSKMAKHYTENGEAYQLYLVGRYHAGSRTAEGLRQAIRYFEDAIRKDQNYALAFAGLADAYGLLALYEALPPQESFLKSKEAALKALELDNTLAEAHTSLAYVKLYYDRDLIGSDEEFKKAIELNPNYATAHHWRALALSASGKFDDALTEIKRAQEIDPTSLIINTALGDIYFLANKYDQAIEQCRKTIEMNPKFTPAHTILRQAYEKKLMFNEALAEFQKESELSGGSLGMKAKLGHVYAATGKRAEALGVVNELLALRKRQFIQAYEIAQIYAMLGEQEQALEWIAKAGEEHSFGVAFAAVDPDLEKLRDNPQFQDLLKRLGLRP
ncbi:MAG: eukaryotic-like serine/threonine-protein kinase [Blastocatellia bacterium]|jgi:Tol biopolymer transport system component/serine/threonine protein kinase/tetratricopeptide (TPR) repeat protein|nr:eukaryotic-like serine/threonine-protein kinase [Blastocatellia bacterium]